MCMCARTQSDKGRCVCVLTAYGIDEVCMHTVYRVLDG